MKNNAEFFRIEHLLAGEVEIARCAFAKLKWRAMDDVERTEARVKFIHALDRLSAFTLQGIVPIEFQAELEAGSSPTTPQRLPVKKEKQRLRHSAAA